MMTLFLFMAAAASPEGYIAYISGTDEEDRRVTLLDLASGERTAIGPGKRDGAPAWSPDGQRIAFASGRGDGRGIGIYDLERKALEEAVHARAWNRSPRWSPDGRFIAYAAYDLPDEKRLEEVPLSVLAVYDTQERREAVWGGGREGLMRPTWRSAGELVAVGFVEVEGDLSTDLFIVTPEEAISLANALADGDYAEWAPEPHPHLDALAFDSNDGGDREVFVALHNRVFDISNHRAADWNPRWSPNGAWLSFESFRGGRRGIYRVDPQSLLVTTVAAAPHYDNWDGAWSSDGKAMVIVSNRTGDPELFLVEPASEKAVQLTEHEGPDYAPAWQPRLTQ